MKRDHNDNSYPLAESFMADNTIISNDYINSVKLFVSPNILNYE